MALNITVSVDRLFRDGSLRVMRLVGREKLSALFEYELDVASNAVPDVVEVNLSSMIDEPVRIDFVDDTSGRTHPVWGCIRSIESRAGLRTGDPLVHRLVVVPRLWRATQQLTTRLVEQSAVPKIVLECLRGLERPLDRSEDAIDGGVQGTRVGRRVQYEESTFAFISRLLEEDGIGYRFVHDELAKCERVVLFDHNDALPDALPNHATMPYVRADRPNPLRAEIHDMERRMVTAPGEVNLIDYDHERPLDPPFGAAQIGADGVRAVGAIYTSREVTNPTTRKEADGSTRVTGTTAAAIAKIRLEERLTRRCVYTGRSSRHEMHPGERLRIDGAPFGSTTLELIVVEVRHAITLDAALGRPEGYGNEFVAIGARTPYRPERNTPRARIFGLTYGVVVNEDGVLQPPTKTAAPIDKLGRYRVALYFLLPVVTSWIRRIQPLAGPGSGMHFPLQIGTEVSVAFIDGDPDRPIIVGALPNAITPSPVISTNATQHVIQTSSGARIEIEDHA